MKVGFGEPAKKETSKSETALAQRPQQELSAHVSDPGCDIQGEISSSDLRLPRLNLVAKTGDLSNQFSPGAFVLNKEVVISDGKVPFTVIALRLQKKYQENIPFDDKETQGRTFDTAAEVREAGGTLGFKKGVGIFGEMARIEFLIKAPTGISEDDLMHFTDEIDGEVYARAVFTVASSAYSAVAKPLITAATAGHLKATGLPGGKWELTSRIATGGGFSWWSPVIKAAGKVEGDALEQVRALLG